MLQQLKTFLFDIKPIFNIILLQNLTSKCHLLLQSYWVLLPKTVQVIQNKINVFKKKKSTHINKEELVCMLVPYTLHFSVT